ncbi:hypothetical protein ACELLULO517_26525 [Acidisoma cellulosilytica]|uniref:Uncharacterized protein n=1 Tax=Acidisoma cellulosilyticum TaxID=2802395 RepID=A0A964E6J8_9PROT|nr:hypothetical protein [Acidisoma cellulosilyticum]MCB8883830.1 hypothetical protein [Acidisoma cellulosilyticum]
MADMAQPRVFTLNITRPDPFPSDGGQEITLAYDKGSQTLAGNVKSNSIAIALDAITFPPFLHGFTAGNSLFIKASGLEAEKVDLTGTSAAISKLGQCTEAADFTQLPPPWHAPTAAGVATASTSSSSADTDQPSPQEKALDHYKSAPLATGVFSGKPLSLFNKMCRFR